MRKSEYQNPKSETMFKIQIFKCYKPRRTWPNLFLSFVFWLFGFVSNFDSPRLSFGEAGIRVSNFYLWILNQVHVNKKHLDTVQLQKGQTLVTLLVFTIVAITITSAAVVIILSNSIGTSKLERGTNTYYSAESGAENAILRLLRDPNYAGETLAVDDASVVITVANTGNTYTITSNATLGNFIRSIEVSATFVNNILTVDSWKEVF